jgi:hypothetical protein
MKSRNRCISIKNPFHNISGYRYYNNTEKQRSGKRRFSFYYPHTYILADNSEIFNAYHWLGLLTTIYVSSDVSIFLAIEEKPPDACQSILNDTLTVFDGRDARPKKVALFDGMYILLDKTT